MIKKVSEAKEILEWYMLAGVEETCGDIPFASIKEEKEIFTPILQRESNNGAERRFAMIGYAQDTSGAFQSAQEICAKAESLETLKAEVEKFEGCSLKLTATHTVFGDGNPEAKIFLVGEAPGADEDRIGIPFVGRSGQLLDKMMSSIGIDRSGYYISNILPWRPPGNRTPLDSEIAVCLPFLKRQIDLVDPDYIFILGGSAANSLLETAETISHLRGHWFEYSKSNGKKAKVLASFHPAYLLRTPGQKAKAWADLLRLSKELGRGNNAESC